MRGYRSSGFHELKKSRRRCTPEYDPRLSRCFGTSPGFWLRLQLDFELMRAERENGESGVVPLRDRLVPFRNLTASQQASKLAA